jgi:hypothetical protein
MQMASVRDIPYLDACLIRSHWKTSIIIIIIFFNLRTAAFKAYCAICVRRSNFRHQVPPRESTQRRKVELWVRNVRKFCLNVDLHVTFRDLLTCRKATTWDRRLCFPSEGRRAEEFFALKIRRLWTGANPRTWVPKASTLPLDHRSHTKHSIHIIPVAGGLKHIVHGSNPVRITNTCPPLSL